MRRLRSREINVFSLSMLDVIAAALAAVLILFVLTIERTVPREQLLGAEERARQAEVEQQTAQQRRADAEELARRAETAAREAEERLRAARNAYGQQVAQLESQAQLAADQARMAREQAEAARAQAERAEQEAARVQVEMDALARSADCTVSTDTVRLRFFDHEVPDGDRVRVVLNDQTIEQNLRLPRRNRPLERSIRLSRRVNRLEIYYVDGGTRGPGNTAFVEVDPCVGSSAESHEWRMSSPNDPPRTLLIVRE